MTLAESTVQVFGSSSIQQSLLAKRLKILEQTLQEVNIIVESLDSEKKSKLSEIISEQGREIERYPTVILNQSLSILCSLFENFLIEALEAVLDSKIETIIGLSEQKVISLAEIIRFGTYDKIVSFFKDKIFRVFSRDSIEDKFNKYFGRLGLDIPSIFDMSIFKIEVQEKYRDWKLDKLTNVFNERHDIVHDVRRFSRLRWLRGYTVRS